jgi:hypothetical protein
MAKLTKEKRTQLEEFIRASWEGFSGSKNRYFYNDRDSISEVRRYMHGAIDISKYQSLIIPQELANEDTSYQNINWKPLDIFSKYRRIAVQILMAMKEELSVEIVDSMAMEEREEFFADTLASLYLRDQLYKRGIQPSMAGLPDDLPQDQKELEMYMEFSFKHMAAVEFETVLRLIKSRNKFDEVTYKRLIEDVIDIGVCVTRDEEDESGDIFIHYVDPEYFFCSYSTKPDFSDIEYAGEIKRMTPAECLRLTSDPMETQNIKEIQEMVNPSWANSNEREHARNHLLQYQDLSSGIWNVVYCEFATGETNKFEIRTTKDGRKIFGHETGGSKSKEFMDAEYDKVYEGYYIIGSNAFFGVKEKNFVLRDPDDVKRGKLTYNITAAEANKMYFNSIGRQVIPSIDAINIAWYKLQNAVLRARPSGIAYDLTSLEAVEIGPSGMSPEENIATFNGMGNLAVRMIDEDGNRMQMPLIPLAGGMGQEGDQFMTQISFNENLFRSLTGMNELVDGSSPNPRTLKSVAQQAAQSTNNALKFVHDCVKMNDLCLSNNIIQRVQDQAEGGDIEFYAPSLGGNSVKFFKMTKDHSMRSLGLSFVPKPTQVEEEKFNQALQIALSTPNGATAQITLAQMAMLDSIQNKKYALMYLSYVVEKNLEQARRDEEDRMMRQGELNMQAAQSAEQAKQQTLQMEAEMKLALIDREYQWKMQIAQTESSARMQGDQIGAEARDRESMRMNETKTAIKQAEMIQQEEKKEEEAKD